MYKVALVDDHSLLRSSLGILINTFDNFQVVLEADNGQKFIDQLKKDNLPDIVLLDISMPVMDGFETAEWLRANHPKIKFLVLSMMDDEYPIIKMLKNGARGYIIKNIKPEELKKALNITLTEGFYYNETISSKVVLSVFDSANSPGDSLGLQHITPKEMEYLFHACSEKTHKDIADQMNVSPRTIDSYRDVLFKKFNVKTRIGLVILAIKKGIIKI